MFNLDCLTALNVRNPSKIGISNRMPIAAMGDQFLKDEANLLPKD